jgi:hypothetical protein
MAEPGEPPAIDLERASQARVYDLLLGGKNNFEVVTDSTTDGAAASCVQYRRDASHQARE